jgi:hypothetical protein
VKTPNAGAFATDLTRLLEVAGEAEGRDHSEVEVRAHPRHLARTAARRGRFHELITRLNPEIYGLIWGPEHPHPLLYTS